MQDNKLKQANRRILNKLIIAAIGMFGFGFALVPLYSVICDAFGINGRFLAIESGDYDPAKAEQQLTAKVDTSRIVTVEFLASLNESMPWEFHPMTTRIEVHPGEMKEVAYYAKNLSGKTMIAQAVPSLVPGRAVKYFTKLECFCFNNQTFEVDEAKEMPLRFVVDPALPKDVTTISIAYTFFDTQKNVKNKEQDGLASVHNVQGINIHDRNN